MKFTRVIACLMLGFLCACGGGPAPKPPYQGIKIGRPYEVYGRWYEPKYNPHYDEVGIASWYGPGFHGGHTASGERFDQDAMTAAHKTLPLPSIVRVTNLDNGQSALIKVNDRGPFSHERIIDLSRGAAQRLGVIRTGTAHVRVQFLEYETRQYVQNLQNGTEYAMNEMKNVNPEEAGAREEAGAKPNFQVQPKMFPDDKAAGLKTPEIHDNSSPDLAEDEPEAEPSVPSATPSEFAVVDNTVPETTAPFTPPPPPPVRRTSTMAAPVNANYFVQAGTFGVRGNALNLLNRLSDTDTPQIMEIVKSGKKFYRVMVGPYAEQSRAKNVLSKLTAIGISDARIIRN